MAKNITATAGPCAVESEQQIWEMGYKIHLVGDIAKPYGIDTKLRGGVWKPRTKYWTNTNGQREKVFEGVGEIGLKWLSEVAEKYGLPIVSECMSEMDLRHFGRYLEPDRDYIQIGARTSAAYALLYEIGGTPFGVIIKNPQHGVDSEEALGSIERMIKSREVIYCMRGSKFVYPGGVKSEGHRRYMESLQAEPNQHPDSRNFNNVEGIRDLRADKRFDGIPAAYDPSHVFGGKTHEMRRNIGIWAIKAITEYGYDWVMVEVNDKSAKAKCDKEQALLTTMNGIDWSQTYVGEEPPADSKPLTLADIVGNLIRFQAEKGAIGIPPEKVEQDIKKLNAIRWDASP